ncbi:type I methionyl aminopeptidase [Flocculibacter collagenilyticus]|uniref:type I methionyl aminopeptidase n=1 Tax=Flocculibacter collagenilyticus TaxID=2744479 RepID=UPI0018F5CBE4|nr:type I methionyl aminopeptidase [Flocculibacter collagenilyticus]
MIIKNENDFTGLKKIGRIVALAIHEMGKAVKPGITTLELDDIGAKILEQHGARSAPKFVYQFPAYTCISINEEAAHGIPSDRVIKEGDIVNIDVSAELNGYFADSGHTFLVPPFSQEQQWLVDSTKKALNESMNVARAGTKINQIGKAITKVATEAGFTTIRDLGSHGVGRSLHEAPEFIPNYFDKKDTRRLTDGMVITIEPFLSTKTQYTQTLDDGWTLVTETGNMSAQFEHTMVINKNKPIIMTTLDDL